ncbi:MAG: hypothetical protein INH41_24555 [Myxococcaceae bacterium]|jgi:hypothetical protein|nr:hypothetical protein [Myxococcaceae bacterium]MCA3015573.1 hypothetical protein [Myxococcaceae bacterium]
MKVRRPSTPPAPQPGSVDRPSTAPNSPAPPEAWRAPASRSPPAAAGPDLEGAAPRTGAVRQVDSPFTSEERAALSKKIPCPALAGLFNAGLLTTAKDGTVKIADLERALSHLGPDAATRRILVRGADATDDVKGSFNLFTLNGSNLDHTGSSGIRQNGVHPERFEVLMSFSRDGERLTAKDLADAAERFAREDPGLRGRVTQQAEMSIVLEVFGRRAADGSRYFTRDDARQLFVEGRIPTSWEPPAVPNRVRLHEVLGSAALGLFRQLVNGR